MKPSVSLVAPVRDEKMRLWTFLADLRAVRCERWLREVIVVLNGCTTDTETRLIAAVQPGWPVPLVAVGSRATGGKAEAVLAGLSAATGRYSLLWDADLEYGAAGIPLLVSCAAPRTLVSGVRSGRGWKSVAANLATKAALSFLHGRPPRDVLTGARLAETFWLVRALSGTKVRGYGIEASIVRKAIEDRLYLYDLPVPYRPRSIREGRGVRWYHMAEILGACLS